MSYSKFKVDADGNLRHTSSKARCCANQTVIRGGSEFEVHTFRNGSRTYYKILRNALSGAIVDKVKWWTETYGTRWSVLTLNGDVEQVDIPLKTFTNHMNLTFLLWIHALLASGIIVTVGGKVRDKNKLLSTAQSNYSKNA